MAAHEIVIEKVVSYVATCVCGWRSHQWWETEHGAARDGEFHLDHPVLTTGETPVIEENQT